MRKTESGLGFVGDTRMWKDTLKAVVAEVLENDELVATDARSVDVNCPEGRLAREAHQQGLPMGKAGRLRKRAKKKIRKRMKKMRRKRRKRKTTKKKKKKRNGKIVTQEKQNFD